MSFSRMSSSILSIALLQASQLAVPVLAESEQNSSCLSGQLGCYLKDNAVGLVVVFIVIAITSYWMRPRGPPKNSPFKMIKVPETVPKNTFPHVPKEVKPDENIPDNLEVDVIVVGMGVAGAAAAKAFGAAGRKVLVIERNLAEPDRIVGELMQPGGMAKLDHLGLRAAAEGIDSQVAHGYAVFPPNKEEPITLPFPEINGKRAQGFGFHHGRFVQNLRYLARNQKGVIVAQGTATGPIKEGDRVVGVTYRVGETTKTARAPLTVVVDGCLSNFRKELLHNYILDTASYFYGLVLKTQLPFPGLGHVIIANPGPVLLYAIGTNEVRILIDIPSPVYQQIKDDVKGYIEKTTIPQLPESLRKPVQDALDDGGLRYMPNTFLHPAPIKNRGCVVMADAWNMRHPLTGGGMTVALSDVVVLTDLLKNVNLKDNAKVDAKLDQFYVERKPTARTINSLSYSLYQVFKGTADMEDMRKGCMKYFNLGGRCVNDPMTLLSGLETSLSLLATHYMAVGFYAAFCLLYPIPTPMAVIRAIKMLVTAFNVMFANKDEVITPAYM